MTKTILMNKYILVHCADIFRIHNNLTIAMIVEWQIIILNNLFRKETLLMTIKLLYRMILSNLDFGLVLFVVILVASILWLVFNISLARILYFHMGNNLFLKMYRRVIAINIIRIRNTCMQWKLNLKRYGTLVKKIMLIDLYKMKLMGNWLNLENIKGMLIFKTIIRFKVLQDRISHKKKFTLILCSNLIKK